MHRSIADTLRRLAGGWCLIVLGSVAQGAEAKPAERPAGLVLHYAFDQPTADGLIADLSGQNNHARAVGAKTAAGKKGSGCELASPTDHLPIPAGASLNKRFTVSFWLRTGKNDGVWRQIVAARGGQGFRIGLAGDVKDVNIRGRLVFVVGKSPLCLSDGLVADGYWHHVAATYDGEMLRLFVDTQLQKQPVEYRSEAPIGGDLIVGLDRLPEAKPGASPAERRQAFEGFLDELMVFSRPLTGDENRAVAVAIDPNAASRRFTRSQVLGRLRQLKQLYEEELITLDFYERKVKECEAVQ